MILNSLPIMSLILAKRKQGRMKDRTARLLSLKLMFQSIHVLPPSATERLHENGKCLTSL